MMGRKMWENKFALYWLNQNISEIRFFIFYFPLDFCPKCNFMYKPFNRLGSRVHTVLNRLCFMCTSPDEVNTLMRCHLKQ